MRRRRSAPSASCTASSARRPSPRSNSRFATFTVAIRSTMATAAMSARIASRDSPTITSANECTTGRQTSCRTRRSLLVQPAAESGQLGRRLRERDARPQPADQIDFAPRGVAERPARRHRMRRAPHLDAGRIIDVGRQHSHNRETLFAERDPPADDVTCFRVAATPEAVADCHDRLRAIDIVVAVEHTSRDRVDAEHAEEVARHQSGVHFFYGAVLS